MLPAAAVLALHEGVPALPRAEALSVGHLLARQHGSALFARADGPSPIGVRTLRCCAFGDVFWRMGDADEMRVGMFGLARQLHEVLRSVIVFHMINVVNDLTMRYRVIGMGFVPDDMGSLPLTKKDASVTSAPPALRAGLLRTDTRANLCGHSPRSFISAGSRAVSRLLSYRVKARKGDIANRTGRGRFHSQTLPHSYRQEQSKWLG